MSCYCGLDPCMCITFGELNKMLSSSIEFDSMENRLSRFLPEQQATEYDEVSDLLAHLLERANPCGVDLTEFFFGEDNKGKGAIINAFEIKPNPEENFFVVEKHTNTHGCHGLSGHRHHTITIGDDEVSSEYVDTYRYNIYYSKREIRELAYALICHQKILFRSNLNREKFVIDFDERRVVKC